MLRRKRGTTTARRRLRRRVPLLVGVVAAACCVAAAGIVGAGVFSQHAQWQAAGSRSIVIGGVLGAENTMSLNVNAPLVPSPGGPPGNPSPRATVKLVQGDPGTSNSLGQELNSWATQSAPGGTPQLNAVDATDGTHIWAVGASCTLLFSANGTTWTKDTNVSGCPSGTSLNGVSLTANAGPGWAAGSNGTILVCASACNTAAAQWSALTQGSVVGKNDGTLNGTTAAQSSSLFATDYSGWSITDSANKIPASTTIVSTNTGTKTATLNHTAAAATKDIFTVTAPASVLPPSSFTFTSIWAADASHVYAVGDGKIWACSAACATAGVAGTGNAAWAPLTPAGLTAGKTLASVEGNGTGLVFAVGSGGTLLVCTTNCNTSGAGWAALTGSSLPGGSTNFTSVWASDGNHVWAVGNGAIWACSAGCNQSATGTGSGKAAWAQLNPSFSLPNLLGVTAQGDGPAWAVGQSGALWFCDAQCAESATSWLPIVSPTPNTLRGVTAADATHAWAVGDAGTIVAQISPTDTQNRDANGTSLLGLALTSSLWTDDSHLVATSGSVFDNSKATAGQLMGIKPSPPSWAVTDLTWLDYAMRLLASTAINENSCNPQKASELTAANNELSAGDTEFGKGNYDAAIDHYGKAWQHALNAKGVSCTMAGINVNPAGAPAFSLPKLVPGDSSGSGTITVTNTGTSAPQVVLYEQNVVDGGLLSGSFPLQLRIVKDGTSTLYNGPLSSGWNGSGTSYLVLPGNGSGGSWAVNEQHTFVFTVSWSSSAGNSYQHNTASLNFVWARS